MKKILFIAGFLCLVTGLFAQEEKGFHLSEQITVDSIFLSGNKYTKDKILYREMSVAPGQQIPADSLQEILLLNRRRLYTTALFTDVQVTADTVDANHIHLHVAVKERWQILPEFTFQFADRNFNVWWTEQNRDIARSVIGLSLTHQNFRGNRERLGVATKFGYGREFALHYSKPFIDKKQQIGMGFEAGVYDNKELFYTTDSNKWKFIHHKDRPMIRRSWATVQLSYRPAYASTHYFRIGYKHNRVDDTILKLNPEYYLNGSNRLNYLELSYRLDYNKVDNWAYPMIGTKMVANIFTDIGFQGMEFYTYATLEAGKYNRLASRWYSSFIGRAKLSFPSNQPYISRQALGTKYEYVRGYELYVIDGYQYGLLRGNLKYELFHFSLRNIRFKYLPVIPVRVYPKLFADGGYVWNPTPGNSFLNNRALYSFGAGFDIFTAYDFKIRVEYAINHLGQKGLFLHFNAE